MSSNVNPAPPRNLPEIGQLFAIAIPVMLALLSALSLYDYKPVDWQIARTAGTALLNGELEVYSQYPMAQMGPLSLVLSGLLPRWAYLTMMVAAFAWLLHWTRRQSAHGRLLHMAAGLVVAPLWAYVAATGHADEVIVLCSMAAIPRSVDEGRSKRVAALITLAVAAKPTALLLFPMAVLLPWPAALAAATVSAAFYLPFFVADAGAMLSAGAGFNAVHNGSLLDWIGYAVGAEYPGWVRPAQLVVGWFIVWTLGRHRGLAIALMAAWTWRAVLEPGPWGSYGMPVIVAAFLLPSATRCLIVAVLGAASWLLVFQYPQTDWQGAGRIVLLCVAVLVAWSKAAQNMSVPPSGRLRLGSELSKRLHHRSSLPHSRRRTRDKLTAR